MQFSPPRQRPRPHRSRSPRPSHRLTRRTVGWSATAAVATLAVGIAPLPAAATATPVAASGTASVSAPAPAPVVGYSGATPYGIAGTPDGDTFYVTDYASNSVSVIDAASNTVTGTVDGLTVTSPFDVAVSPDGTTAYVTGGNAVSVIDTATDTEVGTVQSYTGYGTNRLAFSPDGSTAYVADGWNKTLHVIDTTTHTVTSRISGFAGYILGGVAVSPDGSRVYVANLGSNSVVVIDTATNRMLGTVYAYNGLGPHAIVFAPDGRTAFATNTESGTVSVIDVETSTEISSFAVGNRPTGIALSKDGAFAYATNLSGGTVSIIDTAARSEIGAVPGYVGAGPIGIALTSDDSAALVIERQGNAVTRISVSSPSASVASMSPSRGVSSGGTVVTILGERLTGTTAVTFGDTDATDIAISADGTTLTATAPANAQGPVDVVVRHPSGDLTLDEPFRYFTVPGAPTRVAGTSHDGTVDVTWSAPESDGGATLTGYSVWHAAVDDDEWTLATETEALSARVTGLDTGAAHRFRAIAHNEAGAGEHTEILVERGVGVVPPGPTPTTAPETGAATGAATRSSSAGLTSTGFDAPTALLFIAGTLVLGGAGIALRGGIRRGRGTDRLSS